MGKRRYFGIKMKSVLLKNISGKGEIRTLVTIAGKAVFETAAFNHSATFP